MTKAIDVAAEMVRYANDQGKDLTHMQLQKMVYIAHGISLAERGERGLLDEAVDAWKYGPVIEPLYKELKPFGARPVKVVKGFTPDRLSKEDLVTIRETVDKFSGYSGVQLSELTHKNGSPWHKVWFDQSGHEIQGAKIPNAIIEEHYKEIISTGEATAL